MKADKNNYYAYNKELKTYARQLRKEMTKAEACLWKYALKNRKMKGYQFRRQRPVLDYIADFMCKELKLIIETDGITHTWEESIAKDKVRDKKLEAAGFHILRFEDEEVLRDINRVIFTIEEKISEIENTN